MEYEYDSLTINPRNASCQQCYGNASVHFATFLLTVNCQLSTVNWIHTFSAKEKDTETGLSYFGARYYSSDLSIWLSVDPMSDKYPSLSPYVYCANNPIKLVDPNGEWPEDRARRFMKKHENAKLYRENNGNYSVQFTDPKDKGVVIRLKQFKMNFFERIISRIQRPNEKIEKRQTHRGGLFGVTSDPNSYPPGQDESTDSDIKTVNLDALQQFYVPKSHSMDDITYNKLLGTHENNNESSLSGREEGTSGEFIFFYDKPQKNGLAAFGVKYSGTTDSIEKRTEQEKKGFHVGYIDIDH